MQSLREMVVHFPLYLAAVYASMGSTSLSNRARAYCTMERYSSTFLPSFLPCARCRCDSKSVSCRQAALSLLSFKKPEERPSWGLSTLLYMAVVSSSLRPHRAITFSDPTSASAQFYALSQQYILRDTPTYSSTSLASAR